MLKSSRLEVFCKKVVLRNFAKLTGKHLCQSLRPATLFKKRLWHRCFLVNFAKFLRTSFFIEHLRWLLLNAEKGANLGSILLNESYFFIMMKRLFVTGIDYSLVG